MRIKKISCWLVWGTLLFLPACVSEGDAGSFSYFSATMDHILISLIGSMTGLVLGGGLGILLVVGLRKLFSGRPQLQELSIFFPWRTLVMGLLVLLGFPVKVVVFFGFGLGAQSGMVVVGLIIFLLSITVTTTRLLEHWLPTTIKISLFTWARTLITSSVIIALFLGPFALGGLGFSMKQNINLLNDAEVLRIYGIVIAILLTFDLVLGTVQFAVFRNHEKLNS
jgi:hypothetical protein